MFDKKEEKTEHNTNYVQLSEDLQLSIKRYLDAISEKQEIENEKDRDIIKKLMEGRERAKKMFDAKKAKKEVM